MPAHLIAEDGPERGLILHFTEGEDWVIGRDPDEADFVIEDSTVSRKHARITKTPGGIYIKNLSRINPTLVNGEIFEDRLLLKEGDRVQVGNTLFLFSEEEVAAAADKAPKKKKKKKGGYDDIFGDLEAPTEKEEESYPSLIETQEPLRKEEVTPNAYDTIFEDAGHAGDMPFNMITEAPLLLKVISGPNAGAEIGIEKGRTYLIGKDANTCDIVFQDLSVSRNHARLHISPSGIIDIEDLGSKNGTVVNGQPVLGNREITPQDMVSLGTTAFLVIDRESPQETIYSPMIPSYESSKMENEEALLEEALEAAPRDWKKEKIPPKYLILAGSFAALFLIVFLSFFSLFRSEKIDLAIKEPVDDITHALKKFTDVQFSFNPAAGKLFLTGHVASGVEFQEMHYNLQQIPFIASVEDTVVIDDLVSKMMNDVISTNSDWRGVSISSPQPGKFLVSGYIQTGAESQKLADYLTVNFPYLDRLENRVAVEELLNTQVLAILASQGFGSLSFNLNQGELVLSGPYSEQMGPELETALKQLNALPGIRGIKNFAVPSHLVAAGTDLSEQFQVSGTSLHDGAGYSVVLNGKIYTLGDLVEGMKIISIEPNTILLEKEGLKYKINYTR